MATRLVMRYGRLVPDGLPTLVDVLDVQIDTLLALRTVAAQQCEQDMVTEQLRDGLAHVGSVLRRLGQAG